MYLQLSEFDIQGIALEFLEKYYRKYSSNGKVAVDRQQYNRRNGKEADGLIAFHQGQRKIITVSLEVKKDISSPALNLAFDESKGNLFALIGAGIAYITLITYLHLNFGLGNFDTLAAWASYLLLLSFFFPLRDIIRRFSFPWAKNIGALQQLTQYPGNECWLAFGYYEPSERHEKLQLVRRWCEKKGVGLLLVRPYGQQKVKILNYPGYKVSPAGASVLDYYYRNADSFRKKIISRAHSPLQIFWRTRGQWRYRLKICGYATLFVFGILPFMGDFHYPAQGFSIENPPLGMMIPYQETAGTGNESQEKKEATPQEPPPCAPPSFRGERYLLIDSMHKSLEEAEKRVALLRDFQFQAGYFWLPCIQSDKTTTAYCVYTGQAFTKHKKAAYALDTYRFHLLAKGIEEVEEPFLLKAWQ